MQTFHKGVLNLCLVTQTLMPIVCCSKVPVNYRILGSISTRTSAFFADLAAWVLLFMGYYSSVLWCVTVWGVESLPIYM